MTVALTGASGFVGQALTRLLLAEGYHVRALVRQTQLSEHNNLEIVHGDIASRQSVEELVSGADVVIHLAGLVKSLDKERMTKVNNYGSGHLVKASERQGVKRFLYISSLAARHPDVSHYAKTKHDGEAYLYDLPADGMHWDILRPPAVYGPGDTQVFIFFKMLKSRLGVIPGRKEARLSLIHVQDLAEAIYAWIHSKTATQSIYELSGANDSGYSWDEIFETASRHLDIKPVIFRLPSPILHAAAWAGYGLGKVTGKMPMLLPDKIGELQWEDWCVRDTNFETKFDWSPKIDMDKGFEQTVNWYYQHGWL